ncbi:transposase [Cysteiniphilum sp. JM-1]|uniref:transposase n=1 Tax=Cysteiniphilum sp. JM-1 TaxID=2610891 RepID=UPI001246A8C4|nr:transposase [Cysteiniphilum sp. JM-1]
MQPKRLTQNAKKQLLTDCIKSGCVTDIANKHNVTRKTVYSHINKVSEAIDQSLSKPDDVLFYIPVIWEYIAMIVVLLFIICKSSVRSIVYFIKYALGVDVSVGKVCSILDEATVKAKEVNDSYRFDNCKNSATDELFHQGNPVLAAIDLDSQFCLELQQEYTRDHNAWGYHLLNMMDKGYNPDHNVMDGGSGMDKAFTEVLPNVKVRYDHFHVTQSIKEASRFLKNKYESSVTNCVKQSTKLDKAKTKQQQRSQGYHLKKAVKEMENYDYIYNQFSILTTWLQYDVLQLQSFSPEDRDSLFDFILYELEELAKRHPHRIQSIVTTLKNNKDKLLDVVNELNTEFESLAINHDISVSDIWDICNNARYNLDGNQYDINLIKFYDKHGDRFDHIEDDVLSTIAKVHRSSSLIETLSSRLRPYLDPRKGFKKERFELIQFALNHIPLMRSANEKMKGKSTAEIFTQVDHIDFISLLGFQRFKRVA